MNKFLFSATAILFATATVQAQTPMPKKINPDLKFKSTASGLEYVLIKDAPGSNSPKLGDNVEMHIRAHVGDSVLYDSRQLNDNKPVPFQVMAPSFKGDLAEGFMLLTPGDSAVFRVPLDSLKKTGAQTLPWMKEGDKIQYEVTLVSVKSQELLKKEQEAKAAAQKLTDEKLLKDYFKKNNIKATRTSSGLYYTVTTPGTGEKPKVGQQITVNYSGKTIEGKPFDSNIDPKFNHVQPFQFTLGRRMVIQGWDEGMALFAKGGKGTLYIPSTMAYGERSPSADIPANGILIFDVEVTDIRDQPAAPAHNEHDGHNH